MPKQQPSTSHYRTCTVDSVLTLDPNLLTPPRSLTDDDRPPLQPDDLDNVSLSMKKSETGGKHRRRLNRACASSGDMGDEKKRPDQAEQSRTCTSLPDSKYTRLATNPVPSPPGDRVWWIKDCNSFLQDEAEASSDSRHASGAPYRPGDEPFQPKYCQQVFFALRTLDIYCYTSQVTRRTAYSRSGYDRLQKGSY
jgi:hypothetical protein